MSGESVCKTLIVQNDAIAGRALKHLAKLQGHKTLCATTLTEAIHHLTVWQPNRVLLDLKLPDGNGADLLRRIRQLELPIRVGVVSKALDDAPRELDALGADFIVQAPIDIRRLVDWLTDSRGDAETSKIRLNS